MFGEDFDMDSAVEEVSNGLGFKEDNNEGGNSDEDSPPETGSQGEAQAPVVDTEAAVTPAAAATSPQPRTWRPEALAEWGKLSPVVQQEILKREEDIHRGLSESKAAADFGNSLKTVLDPYMPLLEKYNIKPDAQVADMMQAHYTLAFGSPEDKVGLLQQIAKDYNINLSSFSGGGEEAPTYSPEVVSLQNQVKALESKLTGFSDQQFETKKAEITSHVEKFAVDPKNTYFVELADDISSLLRSGAEKSVEAAYETALWRNPVTRQKELDRQNVEKVESAKKIAGEKVVASRKASSANVRSTAKGGSSPTPLGSIDDTIASTLRDIKTREG